MLKGLAGPTTAATGGLFLPGVAAGLAVGRVDPNDGAVYNLSGRAATRVRLAAKIKTISLGNILATFL